MPKPKINILVVLGILSLFIVPSTSAISFEDPSQYLDNPTGLAIDPFNFFVWGWVGLVIKKNQLDGVYFVVPARRQNKLSTVVRNAK